MSEITKRSISPLKIDRSKRLESLLEAAVEGGFIDEYSLSGITNSLGMFLMTHAVESKTPGLSSIGEKRLNMITDEAIYFIGLALAPYSPDEALEKILNEDFERLYSDGKSSGTDLFETAKKDYLKLSKNPYTLKNAFFLDLIQDTIPEALSNIEHFYGSIDAFLEMSQADKFFDFSFNVTNYKKDCAGIEKVASYIHSLACENEFLLNFESERIEFFAKDDSDLPRVYDPFMGNLDFSAETAYIPVLSTAIRTTLLGKDPIKLDFGEIDKSNIEYLMRGKTKEEKTDLYSRSLLTLKDFLHLDDEVYEYARKCLGLISKQ